MQTLHYLAAQRQRVGPVVAASANGQECHGGIHHVHRVETVFHEPAPRFLPGEALTIEARHCHCSHLYAETVGGVAEFPCHLRLAHLVVEGVALAESTHVHLQSVAAQLFGELELSELLALQHHPVAHSHPIAVLCHSHIGQHHRKQHDDKGQIFLYLSLLQHTVIF